MTLSEIEKKLQDNGYTEEMIHDMPIVIIPSRFVEAFGLDVIRMAHILVVDKLIVKDRTGVLLDNKIDITDTL